MRARASPTFVRTFPLGMESTNPLTAARRGRTSAFVKPGRSAKLLWIRRTRTLSTSRHSDMPTLRIPIAECTNLPMVVRIGRRSSTRGRKSEQPTLPLPRIIPTCCSMTWNARRPPWSTYGPLGGPGGGLFRSTDGSKSWSHLTGRGLPDGNWARSAVTVSPDGKRVYALISANQSGLYRSDDGGENWTLQSTDSRLTSRSWYFGNITVDPKNKDVVYIPSVALYRSEDGGKTISIVRGAPGGDDYHQLWIDPQDSNRMVLGTDQGVTISVDYGKTWSSWYNQPTAQLYHVTADDRF